MKHVFVIVHNVNGMPRVAQQQRRPFGRVLPIYHQTKAQADAASAAVKSTEFPRTIRRCPVIDGRVSIPGIGSFAIA